MKILFSILAVLMQCSSSFAATPAETWFVEIWQRLPSTFAPCLTPANRCALSDQERSELVWALRRRSRFPLVSFAQNPPPQHFKIASAKLHSATGEIRTPAELTEVALVALLDCESNLIQPDQSRVAAEALRFSYYQELILAQGKPGYVSLRDHSLLTLEKDLTLRDLSKVLRIQLQIPAAEPMALEQIQAQTRLEYIEISGVITAPVRHRFRFLISPGGGLDLKID